MPTELWWLKPLALLGAGLWLSFGVVRVWLGWGVRRLYAGPPWPEESEERVRPVVCYRVGVAIVWTTVVVMPLLLLSFLWRKEGVPFVPFLISHWWMAVVLFSWNAVWQLERLWDDLNRTEQD